MKILKGVVLMGLMAFLSACAGGPTLDYYKGSEPPLELKEYFTGPIKAWGLVQDRKGHVTRRFDVTMVGTWEGDTGTLVEHFEYYDGEKQERIWTIKKMTLEWLVVSKLLHLNMDESDVIFAVTFPKPQ